MSGETTLADLLKLKGCLRIKCHACRRETLLFPVDLTDRLPLTTAVSEVTPRFRCSKCGSTSMSVYEAYR
jgi:Zn finger protein HypA/HybF involved in hydrogenase expression